MFTTSNKSNNLIRFVSVTGKPANSNFGLESSLSLYIPLLTWLPALRAAWSVQMQQEQKLSSINLNLSLQSLVWLQGIWNRQNSRREQYATEFDNKKNPMSTTGYAKHPLDKVLGTP